MQMDVDQKLVCNVPMELIDNVLNTISEEDWYDDDYRANVTNMDHTNSIPIFHSPLCASGKCDDDPIMDISERKHYSKYFPVIEPLLNILKEHYDFKQYAAFLTRCNPKSVVGSHKDRGNFLTLCHRIHIPIQTNDQAMYIIENKMHNWKKGNVYEFDNMRSHSVYNGGDEPRIHLIINLYNLDHLPVTI